MPSPSASWRMMTSSMKAPIQNVRFMNKGAMALP